MGCTCFKKQAEYDFEKEKSFLQNSDAIKQLIILQSVLRGYLSRKKNKGLIHSLKIQQNRTISRKNSLSRNKIEEEDMVNLFKTYPPLKDNIPIELRQKTTLENQAEYCGEWSTATNERHGRGIQVWIDGSRYEGYWVNNKANKKGKLLHSNGDIYDGEWLDDKADGYGIYLHTDGAKYEGYWKDDKQNGKGVETWPDGTSYEGNYVDGKKNGYGIFRWNDGSIYEGEFVENNICGMGTYKWSDQRQYSGSWKNNKMDGKGVFTWQDGRRYEGEYKDDKKDGYGIFTWAEGKIYKGYWKNGKQHGEGEMYNVSTRKWRKGIRENGKRKNWIDQVATEEDNNNINKDSVGVHNYKN